MPNTELPDAEELGERLNALLSDPESMQKLIGMASGLASSGLFSAPAAPKEETPRREEQEEPAKELPKKTGLTKAGAKHKALLCALRPYLNEERQMRIDSMMKLIGLAELAETVMTAGGQTEKDPDGK